MSARTPGPMPRASVLPVSAWRTTATFSATAGRLSRNSPEVEGSTSTRIPLEEILGMSGANGWHGEQPSYRLLEERRNLRFLRHPMGRAMSGSLRTYRAKRDFGETPEPPGGDGRDDAHRPRFVVQEHSARSLHWDLRLEHDGVLWSWAVPKGIPDDPDDNHLAVRTEDHPLEYLEFQGETREGEYGAGTMTIYDQGTYEPEKLRDNEVIAVFHGQRMGGGW